jgi:5-methylcytosine-specific restriction endonuclease McrA
MKRGLPAQARVVMPNGKRPCRGCGGEVPKGRLTWCGDSCKERHYMALSTYARRKVFERDRGICAECGCDTEFMARIRWILKRRDDAEAMWLVKAAWGIKRDRSWSVWEAPNGWEADHIVPLAENGTHDLSNYRTLCIPCHKSATRALHARLAASRREARWPDLFAAGGAS